MRNVCHHTDYDMLIEPEAYEDTNVRRLVMQVRCKHCKQPLRFIGIDEGCSLLRPSIDSDGFRVFIPGVMGIDDAEVENRLAS